MTVPIKPWNNPRCNACNEPLEEPKKTLAVWFEDERAGDATHTPMLVHVGACWKRVPNPGQARSIHVDRFRSGPMQPIIIALRSRPAHEKERLVWHAWVSIILGLPIPDGDFFTGTADYVPDHVPLVPR